MVRWLRAAGEGSRLRLLALCAQGPLSVSELAETLRQSEPRVSRHLKILSEAGLIERHRQGQWVQYRVAADPQAASFVARDCSRSWIVAMRCCWPTAPRRAVRSVPRVRPLVRESRLGRALGQLITEGRRRRARDSAAGRGRHPPGAAGSCGRRSRAPASRWRTRAAQRSAARAYRRAPRLPLPGARDARSARA